MTETRQQTELERTLAWLESEFPEWSFEIGSTATWSKGEVELWVATREGDHPQAELTAGKLYTRLTDYLTRQGRRVHAEQN